MYNIHKTLSVAVANADALLEYGHLDIALNDIEKAINKYDAEIACTDTKRHYPTYARATRLYFKMLRYSQE
jgi:tetratricopeptide (TPR) repeat protein